MESTDTQRLGKSSPNGKCGTNRNTSRLSFPEAAARRVDFLSCTRSAGSRDPPTCRHHRMPLTRPTRSYASNQNATSLPCPKEVRYRKTAGPGSLQQEIPDKCPEFLRSYHVSSKPSPDESQVMSRKAANRKQDPGRYPFAPSAVYAPYLLLGGQVPGIPDPAPFGRSVRSTYPAGRGFRRAAGWR